eukprot:tig00000802_g4266.t1
MPRNLVEAVLVAQHGDVIEIPDGVHKFDGEVEVPWSVTIRSASGKQRHCTLEWNFHEPGTFTCLKLSAANGTLQNLRIRVKGVRNVVATAVECERLSSWSLEGVDVKGLPGGVGVHMGEGSNGSVRRCVVHNCSWGIEVYKCAGLIEDCKLHHCKVGLAVRYEGARPTVKNCEIHVTRIAGILVEGNAEGYFEKNEIYCCGGSGIEVSLMGSSPVFKENKIHDVQGNGAYLHHGARPVLDENEIYECLESGVVVYGEGSLATLQRNEIRNCNGSGVRFERRAAGSATENEVHHVWEAGIVTDGAGAVTKESNKVSSENLKQTAPKGYFRGEENKPAHPDLKDLNPALYKQQDGKKAWVPAGEHVLRVKSVPRKKKK